MKKNWAFLSAILLTILLSSCAEKVDLVIPANLHEYGFFSGLWHGFIAPFSLIGMFFNANVVVFAANNSGFSYALGFLIGSGGWGVFASNAKKSTVKKN